MIQVGLPWKFDEPGLVDNFTMALGNKTQQSKN